MLELIAKKLTQYLVDCEEISSNDDEFECYKYGIELTLSSLLNAILVLTIGITTNKFIESIIFMITFVAIRQFTGGYHADTYFKCNLCLCILFGVLLALYDLLIKCTSLFFIIIVIDFISISLIAIFSPVENKNKCIENSRKIKLKWKAVLISFIVSIVSIVMHCNLIQYGALLSCTLLLIAMLIITGKIKERRTTGYEK